MSAYERYKDNRFVNTDDPRTGFSKCIENNQPILAMAHLEVVIEMFETRIAELESTIQSLGSVAPSRKTTKTTAEPAEASA